jgi:hypothetical protein
MPIPSLNLGALAGRVDAAIGRTVGGSLRNLASREAARGAGPLTAHVARSNPALAMAMKGTSRTAAMGGRLALAGMGLGLSVGAAAAVGAVGVAYGASRAYNAAMNAPSFHPGHNGGLPYVNRGGNLLTWEKHGKIPFTGRHLYSPMASQRTADVLGSAGVTAGIIGGIRDANNGRNWNVTQALSTGALEVERDNFMGATGSLTLAMYKQRHGKLPVRKGRPSALQLQQADQMGAMEYGANYGMADAAMKMNRAEMVHAIHLAHMAAGG